MITASYRQQSIVLTRDCCNERQRLYQANGRTRTSDCISLKREKTAKKQRISNSCGDATQSGTEYLANFSHSRLSTPTISYDHVTPSPATNTNHRQTISQRTTKMLVICSTTFLIFNSPYCAVLLYSVITKHVLTRTMDILRYFYFMSFCLNFFLYSLCGNRFRHELVSLSKACCRKCCPQNLRQHWLKPEKMPQQSSDSRATIRTGV